MSETSHPGEEGTGKQSSDPTKSVDEQNAEVTSRSADPGQSSYGGFKDEGPSVENDHDADEAAEKAKSGPGGNASRP